MSDKSPQFSGGPPAGPSRQSSGTEATALDARYNELYAKARAKMEQIQKARSESSSMLSSKPPSPNLAGSPYLPSQPVAQRTDSGDSLSASPALPPRKTASRVPSQGDQSLGTNIKNGLLDTFGFPQPPDRQGSGGLSPSLAGSRRPSAGATSLNGGQQPQPPPGPSRISSFGVPVPPELHEREPIVLPYNPAYADSSTGTGQQQQQQHVPDPRNPFRPKGGVAVLPMVPVQQERVVVANNVGVDPAVEMAERIRRLELEEKSRREELDRLRKEEADRIAREEAERQRREAEERARREAETRARLEAEQRAQEQLRAEEDRLRRERESRIALLEAERVRAESETLRKRQQDELLRQQMAAEEQRLARLRLEEERMAMTMQQSVDMAFLFDCTGSMQVWIDRCKSTVSLLLARIRTSYPHAQIRTAFVGYRDFTPPSNTSSYAVEDFCDPARLEQQLGKVAALGGEDAAEDAIGGLALIPRLGWASRTKLMIHVADAPPHGQRFHDFPIGPKYDRYPTGPDPNGKRPEDMEGVVAGIAGRGIDYYFFKVHKCTTKFEREIDGILRMLRSRLNVVNLMDTTQDPTQFLDRVLSATVTSMRGAGVGSMPR